MCGLLSCVQSYHGSLVLPYEKQRQNNRCFLKVPVMAFLGTVIQRELWQSVTTAVSCELHTPSRCDALNTCGPQPSVWTDLF